MDITTAATATIYVGKTGNLSSKRFRDAVDRVKSMGGNYDAATKSWTVELADNYHGQQPKIFVADDLAALVRMYNSVVELTEA